MGFTLMPALMKEVMLLNNRKLYAAAMIIMSLLVIVSVAFSAVNRRADSFTNNNLITEEALYGEVVDSIQTQGFAIRMESVINPNYTGVLNYRVANGSRVSSGGVIADIFMSESDAAAQNMADRMEREIQSLSALSRPMDAYVSASTALGEQIYDDLSDVMLDIQQGDFSGVTQTKEALLLSLSRKQVLSGQESAEDYAQRVSELKREKDSITNGTGQSMNSIKAPKAGYFITYADGLERAVSIDEVENLTPKKLEHLLAEEKGTVSQQCIGKICEDFKWYMACLFDDDAMIKFEGVEEVTLDIPFASTATIPAKVVARNRDADSGKTAVVFECTYMDADLATVRNENVQVNVKTYSGVLVNEKALRFLDIEYQETDEKDNTVTKVKENVKGVYVVYGGQLEFVQVFTEKDVNGYAVCKLELSEDEQKNLVTDHTIRLYDKVVVGGVDLYDGKVVR